MTMVIIMGENRSCVDFHLSWRGRGHRVFCDRTLLAGFREQSHNEENAKGVEDTANIKLNCQRQASRAAI